MSKKKEYNNIFAKIANIHNDDIVPLLKNLDLMSFKIRNRRILKLRMTLESSEDVLISSDLLSEYIIINSFVLNFINKNELNNCYDLLKTKDKDNFLIGTHMIYSLIEEKKLKLIECNKI